MNYKIKKRLYFPERQGEEHCPGQKYLLMAIAGPGILRDLCPENMNVNPLPLFYAFNFGLDQYIFPYEAVYFLYIFITEKVLLRHIATALAIRMLIVGIFVVVLAVPYWKGIGLM